MPWAGLLVAVAAIAQPAVACTISAPYRPLTARPAGMERALVVDVVALDLRHYPTVARVRVVDDGKLRRISYWRAICGGRRDPATGERLVVFFKNSNAMGWATPAEAKAF